MCSWMAPCATRSGTGRSGRACERRRPATASPLPPVIFVLLAVLTLPHAQIMHASYLAARMGPATPGTSSGAALSDSGGV